MADFNMAANMYGMIPNMYNNQVALNDLTGLDMYSPLGFYTNPMMSMNGSIFGSGMGMGMGMYPMMPPMGLGVDAGTGTGTGSGTGSYEDYYKNYYKNYDKYQDFMIDSQVRQQQKWRDADLTLNSPMEGIAKQASYLHERIMNNEQEQIIQSYQKLKNSVKSMYHGATAEEISNRASTLYKQVTGTSITDDIRQYGRGSFTQGFLQTITLGLADKKTAEENIAEITGQPVGRKEKTKKIIGNAVGGATFGGAALISAKYIFKGLMKGLRKIPLAIGFIGGGAAIATAIGLGKSE